MPLTAARAAAGMDTALTGTTHVQWSENGTSQSSNVAGTALPGTPKLSAATSANPSVKANNGALTSAGASAGCTIGYWAFAEGATGGTLDTGWNPLGTYEGPFTALAAATGGNADTITCPAHGFTAADCVQFVGSALPTGLSAHTPYYVRDVATNTFKVETSVGAGAVNITADGSAYA